MPATPVGAAECVSLVRRAFWRSAGLVAIAFAAGWIWAKLVSIAGYLYVKRSTTGTLASKRRHRHSKRYMQGNDMGKHVYVPDAMRPEEAEKLLARIADLIPQVDHAVARRHLNEAFAEIQNEVHNIEGGWRGPEHG